jgi:hypothetical protein
VSGGKTVAGYEKTAVLRKKMYKVETTIKPTTLSLSSNNYKTSLYFYSCLVLNLFVK